ncbi:MAG: arsenite methyltransferase [Deltaproteobacteria bacterium]|nr:arsenite methyltransferase [Deltaproteobacteria bacterium]
MNRSDEIRKHVAESYAQAVRSTAGGCCGADAVPTGVAAKLAGYTSAQLEALPRDAVVSSFGCGNPVAFAEVRPGDVVLDLGSGAGIDILLAAKKVGPTGRVIGVDMTEEMITRARANIAAAGLTNVEVRRGVIEELPVESGTVDWVISNCVINLSPEKDRVFREIARVLKPGGHMVVSDIMVTDLPAWARQSAALYASCIGGAISEEAYLDGLRAAGLVEVEVRERLVYDGPQLLALAGVGFERTSSCCGGPVDEKVAATVADALAGKIWSAKVHARRRAG